MVTTEQQRKLFIRRSMLITNIAVKGKSQESSALKNKKNIQEDSKLELNLPK